MHSVYLFLDSSSMGGIETHVLNLAASLKKQKLNVTVLLWKKYGAHPLVPKLANENIAFRYLNASIFKLLKILANDSRAILHTHGYKANIVGRIASVLLSRRIVCTFHNGDLGEGRVRAYTWLDSSSAFMSRNIAVSREIANRIVGKVRLIPNFVKLPSSKECVVKRDAIAFVGRLEPVKRPDRFIALARQFPHKKFHVYGEGSLLSELRHQAPDNVRFFGFVENMMKEWHKIDLLVICSDYEGMPLCSLEAMSNGVPVLAMPLGDLPELIDHGCNGFIGQTNDDLVEWLSFWLAQDIFTVKSVRERAISTIARNYSEDASVASLLEEYAFVG